MQGIRRAVLPGLVLALAVSACGSSDGSDDAVSADPTPSSSAASPSESPAGSPSSSGTPSAPDPSPTEEVPANAPDCSDVWRDGARLPRTYSGCVEDGAYVRRDVLGCSSGQRLVRFDDAWYGVLGGEVKEAATSPLVDDAAYRKVVVACRA